MEVCYWALLFMLLVILQYLYSLQMKGDQKKIFSQAMSPTNLSTFRPVSSWSVAAFGVQPTALLGSFAGNIPFPFIDSLLYAPHCSFPPAIWVRWSLFFCLYQNCGTRRLSLYSVPLRNEGKKMSCILMLIHLIWRSLSFPRAGSLTMGYDYSLQFGTVSCDSPVQFITSYCWVNKLVQRTLLWLFTFKLSDMRFILKAWTVVL
jgi:hypothetical protein